MGTARFARGTCGPTRPRGFDAGFQASEGGAPFAWCYLWIRKKKPQQPLSTVHFALGVLARRKRTRERPSDLYRLIGVFSMVMHQAPRPRAKDVLVSPVLSRRPLDDIPHSEHGPVGHVDFGLDVQERRLAIAPRGFKAERAGTTKPSAQRNAQALKRGAHGDAETLATPLALIEPITVTVLLASNQKH